MGVFLKDLLSLCPDLEELELFVSEIYSEKVGLEDMRLFNFFKHLDPRPKVWRLSLKFDIYSGAEDLVRVFPNASHVNIY